MDKEKFSNEQGEIRLGIALPLVDQKVHTAFLDSFVLMRKPCFTYIRPAFPSMQIDVIRNQLVKQALESGCTHMLMMDTDQVYNDPDMINKLLAHDKDVVSVMVQRRYPPFDGITLRGEPGKYLSVSDEEIIEAKKSDNHLIEIDATGGGCLLYKTEVFLKIPPAWFEFSKTEGGEVIGEDINFCWKLKQNGYKIYCDTSIDVGHLSTLEINWNTHRLYNHMKKLQNEDVNK